MAPPWVERNSTLACKSIAFLRAASKPILCFHQIEEASAMTAFWKNLQRLALGQLFNGGYLGGRAGTLPSRNAQRHSGRPQGRGRTSATSVRPTRGLRPASERLHVPPSTTSPSVLRSGSSALRRRVAGGPFAAGTCETKHETRRKRRLRRQQPDASVAPGVFAYCVAFVARSFYDLAIRRCKPGPARWP